MTGWDMNGGSTDANCFVPMAAKHKTNIVFNRAYVGHWGTLCMEWYLYTGIILTGIVLWLPVDFMPSPCLKWFTCLVLFPPVIGHLCVWLRKRLRECKGRRPGRRGDRRRNVNAARRR